MSDGGDTTVSAHPIDRRIREIIRTRRLASADEIDQIIERIAAAPFDSRVMSVPRGIRGQTYQGQTLTAREDSLTVHLIKRIVVEGQWMMGTTAMQYLDDLHQIARHPTARLGVYERRGGHIAVVFAATALTLPAARIGSMSLPYMLVVYLADRGIIVSGYQVSDLAQTGIPEEIRWLK